jgi:hypothetical protein
MSIDPAWAEYFESSAAGALGRALLAEKPFLEVHIPAELAETARLAWDRQVSGGSPVLAAEEGDAARAQRLRAWALAVTGLAVLETGRRQGEIVRLQLPAAAFARAICAAIDDDAAEDL